MMISARPLWIDEQLRDAPSRPWRKIHLDFHNSQHIPRIGEAFDPDEFGDRLLSSHVNAIVVFAKDMHGYCYYPSTYGPIQPGLSFDLLGAQVEACRKRAIKVYAYYCTTWDNYLAEHHPEWLVFKRDRTTYLPAFDETPGWTALCLSNEDFVGLVLDHSREILERYELDGIWYDMPLPIGGECFCRNCLAALRTDGLDPFDKTVQRRHKQQLLVDFLRRAHELARAIRPGCQVDHNNQTRLGLGERIPYLDNIDIEALPTAFWGYSYFPANVRYARTFGKTVYGMSGRFHGAWADFGGLKHPTQLRTELAWIVANGAHCDLGDQMPPSGRLDPAVYETIGQCYAEIERLEPFLEQAVPVTEAAIVVNGDPLEDLATTRPAPGAPGDDSVYGLTKLLMELHVQFDIVEPDVELERYRLLVLPATLTVDETLAARLRAYLSDGGAIVADSCALRLHGSDLLWADDLGLTDCGESPFAPAYLKLDRQANGPALFDGLPDYEYALYDGALQWRPASPNVVLARLGEPLFQRSPAHYTSHQQTPFDHLTDYAAVVLSGRLAATAFPVGSSYYRHGYWIYREVFHRLLRAVLAAPLIETSAPISAEVTVTHQSAEGERPERWLVHVVSFSPNRRGSEHCEYLEDPIPLHDVKVSLRIGGAMKRAYIAAEGTPLPLRALANGWEVVIPRVDYGAIAVFER
jgi:Hypothetical glycosyl hydrolase 6/Beta-galactosidase trimerisation domain